jgi:hypothetical protein
MRYEPKFEDEETQCGMTGVTDNHLVTLPTNQEFRECPMAHPLVQSNGRRLCYHLKGLGCADMVSPSQCAACPIPACYEALKAVEEELLAW